MDQAKLDETLDALLDKLTQSVPHVNTESKARIVVNLAEAYAWLRYPNQPHGSTSPPPP